MTTYNERNMEGVINSLAYECHQNAVLHGFYDPPPTIEQRLLLQVSEIVEQFEGIRNNINTKPDEHCPEFCNEEIEMADLIIRILDYAAYRNLRIGEAILAKHSYNKTRPYKHNKAF